MGDRPAPRAEVRIRAVAAGGAGVGELPDGRVAFVHRTAPGDLARVEIMQKKARWARARLVELLEAGEGRREPLCRYYGRCGGCTLEHLHYEVQLHWKGRLVADALARIAGRPLREVPPVEASPEEFRYRSRVSCHLRRVGRRVIAGFHELEHPDRVVDVDGDCLLPEASVAAVWDGLRSAWGPTAERLPSGRELRLTLRRAARGVVLLIEGGQGEGRPAELIQSVEGLIAIWHRARAGAAPRLLAGDEDVQDEWMGQRLRTGPTAFLQVNRAAGHRLHEALVQEIGAPAGLRVVDAYAGVGSLGRRLAEQGALVTAIELDEGAARAAQADAPDGFRVLVGRVEERLDEAFPADLVLLNPPRTGVPPGALARVAASGVERVVYVSCDPATLARDVARLGDAYYLASVRCFDLFPQTAHVETVAALRRVTSARVTDAGARTGPPQEGC